MLTLLIQFLNSEFKLLSLFHITPSGTESNCPQSCTKPNRTILIDQLFSTAFLSIQCDMSRKSLSQPSVRIMNYVRYGKTMTFHDLTAIHNG